jgi:hypothetical protein
MIMDDSRTRMLSPALLLGSLVTLAFASAASAQTNSALLITPFPKEQAVQAEGGAIFLESGHVAESGVDEDFQMSIYGAAGKVRLKPGVLESPRIGFDVSVLDIQGGFDGLPDYLADQSVAVGFPVGKYKEWIFGASVGVGYAGDSHFGDGDAFYGLASLAAFWQMDETSALVFVLDYDGNRTFLPDIPLPGAAYIKRIDDKLELTAGLPISSIRWKPIERLTVEVAFSVPEDVRVDVGYELLKNVTIFGRARQDRNAFFVDGLPENYDRILFEQRRAEAGVRFGPTDYFSADLAVGYAWNTEFSEGFDSRETNEIADVSDEPYIRAGLEVRF